MLLTIFDNLCVVQNYNTIQYAVLTYDLRIIMQSLTAVYGYLENYSQTLGICLVKHFEIY